jgi:ribosomal protein S18 acetylase RimI-like enzyme
MGAMLIRALRAEDRAAVEEMLTACGAFSGEEIRVALELVDAGLENGDYALLALEIAETVRGFVCFGETPLTASTWDLYWLCIHPDAQRTGAGRALQAGAEECARERGGERIRVETSGRADYARARGFYEKAGYRVVGVIPDFYKPGDDCVIFCKALSPGISHP